MFKVIKSSQQVVEEARKKQEEEARANRQAAYVAESDPIFFKAQRGDASMRQWQMKVDEIKRRFPKV